MANRKRRKTKKQSSPQILAMGLIGAGLLIFGVLAFVLLPKPEANAGSGSEERSVTPAQVDFPAPELALNTVQGDAASLADYRGQVILVNNWATWCPPCRAEMPTLKAYFEKYAGEGFTIVAIEAGDPQVQVADFVEQYGLTFPVWVDPGQDALLAFRNMSLPNSYVIDRQGQVRLAWTGAISASMLEKHVTPLLKE